MKFGPWCAAPASGTATFGLTSSAVSCSDQRRVPGDISVEGIAFTLKGALPDEGFCFISRRKAPNADHATTCKALAQGQTGSCGAAEPFTIQLRFLTTEYTQPAIVGVDTGSRVVGIAATTNGQVVFQAEVHLRDDIGAKMVQRRMYRRNRRARKTRYRAPRWLNRRRSAGWLPPSL